MNFRHRDMRQQLLIGRTVIARGMIRATQRSSTQKTRVCAQSTRAPTASVRNSRNNVNGVEPRTGPAEDARRDTASAQRAASNPAAHDATPSTSADIRFKMKPINGLSVLLWSIAL